MISTFLSRFKSDMTFKNRNLLIQYSRIKNMDIKYEKVLYISYEDIKKMFL